MTDEKRKQLALESIAVSLNSIANTLEVFTAMVTVALQQAAAAESSDGDN